MDFNGQYLTYEEYQPLMEQYGLLYIPLLKMVKLIFILIIH